MHYFNQKPQKTDTYIPEQTQIPTSKIIEIALQISTEYGKEKGFNHFNDKLKKVLIEYENKTTI